MSQNFNFSSEIASGFSIGIPTYNRANFLKISLDSAVCQTAANVEVIVSDNCSEDNTENVVKSHGHRVVYKQNSENTGAISNFIQSFQLSHGRYFSWLQDDDLLHEDFVSRASAAFGLNGTIKAYVAFALYSSNPQCHVQPTLYGPPFALDWFKKSSPKIISGTVVTPLSLFMTIGFCPTAAFEREALASALCYASKPYWLLSERTILAKAASQGSIAVEPFVAGLFRSHGGQASRIVVSNRQLEHEHWVEMARDLSLIAEEIGPRWKTEFANILPSIDVTHRVAWAKDAINWQIELPFCAEVRSLLFMSLPKSVATEIHNRHASQKKLSTKMNKWARLIFPPITYSVVRRLRRILNVKTKK